MRIKNYKRKIILVVLAIIYLRVSIDLALRGLWWLLLLIPVLAAIAGFLGLLFIFAEANKAHYPPDLFVDEISFKEK